MLTAIICLIIIILTQSTLIIIANLKIKELKSAIAILTRIINSNIKGKTDNTDPTKRPTTEFT